MQVVRVKRDLPVAAPQRAAVRLQCERLGRAPRQVGVALRDAGIDRPSRIDAMLDRELVARVAHVVVAVARLAEKARRGDHAQLPVDREHAAIERCALTRTFELVVERRVRADVPRERRREQVAFARHRVAKAAVVLVHRDEAVRQRLRDGAGRIEGLPQCAVAAGRHADGGRAGKLRLLGRIADDPARIAAAIQRGRRPLEHFHPFEVDGVARHAHAAIPRKAVDEVVGAGRVAVAGEAAHRVVVPQAAEVVLARDARDPVVEIVAARGGHGLDQLRVDAADRERNLHHVRLAARRARRFARAKRRRRALGGDLDGG